MQIKRQSKWEFVTSSSGGIGVEFVAAEGGKIYLKSPSGVAYDYSYGALGGGISYGFKLPKIGKVHLPVKGKSVTGNVAPASFPNTGTLYVLDGCENDELTADDIAGGCMFVEVSGGLIAGGSAMAMLVGIPAA